MIFDHLHENPEDVDTLEGMAEWWLNSKKIEITVDDVANAVECLIEKGIVIKEEIGNSKPVYKITK